VLVQDDTNTALSGALSAAKLKITVAHVEAGLRSFDVRMPEEINRTIINHLLSTLLFAPTNLSKRNLKREGITMGVFVTGNTIVDALQMYAFLVDRVELSVSLLKEYVLLTLHRQETVDDPQRLANVLKGVGMVAKKLGIPVLFPIHPRTRIRMNMFGIPLPPEEVVMLEPQGYFQFLKLLKSAKVVLTDSGGVQEEACILKVPCVTLRHSTERPETVYVGANAIAGLVPEHILEKTLEMVNKPRNWRNPLGDGMARKRIIRILLEE
jgi:UDP-N-acetylglucosamine 2-epimerase (non-hydrolysing)